MSYSNINRLVEENLGGSKRNLIIIVSDSIVNFPDIIDCTTNGNLEINSDIPSFTFYFTFQTLQFNEKAINRNGSLDGYLSTISGIIPKDKVEKLNDFKKMVKKRFVLIHEDNNGIKRIMGNKATPAKMTFDRSTKEMIEKRNEYRIKFEVATQNPVPFFSDNSEIVLFNQRYVYQQGTGILLQHGSNLKLQHNG